MTKNKILSIAGLVLALGVAAYFIYTDMQKSALEEPEIALGNTETETLNEGQSDTEKAAQKLPVPPELDRGIEFKNTLSAEAKSVTIERLNTAITDLKKDPSSYQNWIILGVYRKTLGDYEGARQAWEYAKLIFPSEVVAYHNLGDLYHFFLKDYPKSEINWKKTIALKKDYIMGYLGLVDLYKYSYKEKYKETPSLLLGGIAQNTDSLDLRMALAYYYKDTGDVAHTREALEEALSVAKRLGNTQATTSIEGELAALK